MCSPFTMLLFDVWFVLVQFVVGSVLYTCLALLVHRAFGRITLGGWRLHATVAGWGLLT